MSLRLTAIICAHNPQRAYLDETLDSIRAQVDLSPNDAWELLLIDNASAPALDTWVNLTGLPNARIIREDKLGLTHARLRSFSEARGEILLYIDDDNILAPNYFAETLAAFDADGALGATGGKSLPRWEVEPPSWFETTGISLACRDLGEKPLSADWRTTPKSDRRYPECAPIGAGMGIRKSAYADYVDHAKQDPVRLALGRRGTDLASGEDNDMILTLLANGWRVAYLPQLSLDHIIPESRLSESYLRRYARSSSRTWVQVLAVHDIVPWPGLATWTLPFRKLRAWLRMRPWKGPVEQINWQSACGNFEGRAAISEIRQKP
ncbi:MAG: glycosyltransferase [Pseudomonadota bacterium]